MSFVNALLYLLDLRIFLCCVTILLLSYYVLRRKETRNFPPGPLMLPFVGTLITFALKERQCAYAYRAIGAWREEYGNIFRMRFGPKEAVVIGGYKLVTESLRKHKRVFDARPVLQMFECIMHSYGIFSSNGKMWRETRKFAIGAFREMGVGKKSLEQHIQEEATILVAALENGGKPLNPRRVFMKATANIIQRICFGQRSEYDDAEFCEMLRSMDSVLQTMGLQMLENVWPWIRYLPFLAKVPALKASDDVIAKYTAQRIHDHQASYDAAHTRDLTDLHIQERQTWTDKEMRTDFHMRRTLMDLFLGGTDTSAYNLTWVALHMIHYPQIQTRCQQEIDEVVGSGRMVSVNDRPSLVYNTAVINEILRHAMPVPLNLPREALEDIEIGGYLVPKGAMAIFDLYSVHRDKSYWGDDADEFRPERWIDENGQLRTHDGFMPFANGTRQCVGEPLAMMEAFLFFTNILQRLTFRLPEGSPQPSIEGISPGIVYVPWEFDVISERR